jgi:hypothetical protein
MVVDLKFETREVEGGFNVAFYTPDGQKSELGVFPTESEAEARIDECIAMLDSMPNVKRVSQVWKAETKDLSA